MYPSIWRMYPSFPILCPCFPKMCLGFPKMFPSFQKMFPCFPKMWPGFQKNEKIFIQETRIHFRETGTQFQETEIHFRETGDDPFLGISFHFWVEIPHSATWRVLQYALELISILQGHLFQTLRVILDLVTKLFFILHTENNSWIIIRP